MNAIMAMVLAGVGFYMIFAPPVTVFYAAVGVITILLGILTA